VLDWGRRKVECNLFHSINFMEARIQLFEDRTEWIFRNII